MRILRDESVALVIDIQERLLPHIDQNQDLLVRTEILLKGFEILDLNILATEQYRKGLGPTVTNLMPFLPKSDIIEKISFSCCDNDTFLKKLEDTKAKNVIVCGIETHVCVLQTCIDLIEEGFQPIVVVDCVSSRKPADKAIALERLKQEGVLLSTSESMLFELARFAGTDDFKAISKLVK